MVVDLRHGDCLDVMATLADGCVAAVVTDPPYGLSFMGRDWDGVVPGVPYWRECLRVLAPGGHLLAFGGTRTWHRLAVAIEDAGFELRDSIAWMHGQGFPKGKGQLKPAHEPIVVARKRAPGPWLNIDACRVGNDTSRGDRYRGEGPGGKSMHYSSDTRGARNQPWQVPAGRWPTNVVLTHAPGCVQVGTRKVRTGTEVNRNRSEDNTTSWYGTRKSQTGEDAGYAGTDGLEEIPAFECVDGCPVAELDAQSGTLKSWMAKTNYTVSPSNEVYGKYTAQPVGPQNQYGDSGGASRFFPTFRYQAKASAAERPKVDGQGWPTVKPLALMRWLVRLVTPPGGLVLDPFAGTGTTLQAAELEGFASLGIELDAHAYALACQRLGIDQAELQPTGSE